MLVKSFSSLFFSVHYNCFTLNLITQKELFYMKLSHLSIAFLLLIISQKNFGMGLKLREAPKNAITMGHTAQEVYHPGIVYHLGKSEIEEPEESSCLDLLLAYVKPKAGKYEASCQDLIVGGNAFMLVRHFSMILLPNDPLIATISGATALATTLVATHKIKAAHKASLKKEKID